MEHPFTLIRSNRKTISIEISRTLEVIVRAPKRMPKREVDLFILRHAQWIETHLEKQRIRAEAMPPPSEDEAILLREKARAYIPGRVAHYAEQMGLYPTAVKITSAKTRFGSCSGKNSLCFSLWLMRYPLEAVDYVVVHELAHIRHKNHSRDFYQLVEQYMPDYKARQRMLRG